MNCDFHQFAVELYNLDKKTVDQATIRTCISRLYYSVYHKVYQWLIEHHSHLLNMFNGGSHKKLQYCLEEIAEQTNILKFNVLSMKLNNLHAKRCTADYKLDSLQTANHIELMIKEVNQTITLFNELSTT